MQVGYRNGDLVAKNSHNSTAEKQKKRSEPKSKSKKPTNGKSSKKTKKKENLGDEEDLDGEENKEEDEFEEYVLPGQRYSTPPQGDSQRAFYESLLEQKPDSLMALKWCVEYGVLDQEKVLRS